MRLYEPPRSPLTEEILDHSWRPTGSRNAPRVLLLGPETELGGFIEHRMLQLIEAELDGYNVLTVQGRSHLGMPANRRYRLSRQGVADAHHDVMMDAVEAMLWLMGQPGGPIVVGGYSYGAWLAIGLQHRRSEISGWFAISPPLAHHDAAWGFPSHTPGLIALAKGDCTNDRERTRDLKARLSRSRQTAPVELTIEENTSHLWCSWNRKNSTDPECPANERVPQQVIGEHLPGLMRRIRRVIDNAQPVEDWADG